MPGSLSGEMLWRLVRCLSPLLVTAFSTQAQAASRDRIPTRAERDAIIIYILPVATNALIGRCGPVLADDGYLRTHGAALAARLATGQEAAWPLARRAFSGLASPIERPSGDNPTDAEWRTAFDQTIIEGIGRLSDDECHEAEALIAPLDPLPPDNLVQALSAIATMAINRQSRQRTATLKQLEQ
jgi:hypothetical protein